MPNKGDTWWILPVVPCGWVESSATRQHVLPKKVLVHLRTEDFFQLGPSRVITAKRRDRVIGHTVLAMNLTYNMFTYNYIIILVIIKIRIHTYILKIFIINLNLQVKTKC